MKLHSFVLPVLALSAAALVLTACAAMPVGNRAVPQPAKPVDLTAYKGLWYEYGRYENSFETGCEGVTAEYGVMPDGLVSVTNRCHKGGVTGRETVANGRAKVVADSNNAKLKVSFFGPLFLGDYWVLDHADDYSWSIVGEPSGRYLWLLTRAEHPDAAQAKALEDRAQSLGYDLSLLHRTQH